MTSFASSIPIQSLFRTTRRLSTAQCNAASDNVKVHFRGREISAKRNEKLRDVLLRAGATPHNGGAQVINCRGLGTCGTCAIVLEDGEVHPSERSFRENARLSFPPHTHHGTITKNLRLACQVRLVQDVVVRKNNKFWGQGEKEQPYDVI